MKFCFILTQDLESPSGLGRYLPWGKELNKLGHEVEIIGLHSNYKQLDNKKQNIEDNLIVNYVSQMHIKKEGNTKEYFSFIKLIGIISYATIRLIFSSVKSNADIYIVGKPHPMNGIAGVFCKNFLRKFLIVDCDDDESNSGNFQNIFQRKLIHFFENFIPKFAHLVTTNTKYTQERVINTGISIQKIYYLSNGVDPERFKNIDDKKLDQMKSDLGLKDKKVIAYIGSISLGNHPINLLIDAFEEVNKEGKNFILLIVGGGEDFEFLCNSINKRKFLNHIIFTGRIHPDEVKYYYRLANVTIDPVYNDITARARSPLKLFESLICETPVITMAVGDRIMLKNISKKIYIVENITPKDIADKICLVLNDGIKSHEDASEIEIYYWDNLVKRFISFLEEVYEPF
jgi:glycosyltransferase involved in cell wall biosynthesis